MIIYWVQPTLGNIEVLSHETSLEHIEETHTTAFSGLYLIPKSNFFGAICSVITMPFGKRVISGNIETALKTARVTLELFRQYLLEPKENPESWIEIYLCYCFNDFWSQIFSKTYRLFHPNDSFPSFDRALQIFSPKLMRSLVAAPVPYIPLQKLLRDETISASENRTLMRWIGYVNGLGKLVSQKLFFSFVQQIALLSFEDKSRMEKLLYSFQLALKLQHLGMQEIGEPRDRLLRMEPELVLTPKEQAKFAPIEPLQVAFPLDFPLQALATAKNPDRMIVYSSSPLLLGMYLHEACTKSSVVPFLQVYQIEESARFFVTERIYAWVDDPLMWEQCNDDGKKKMHITNALGNFVRSLFELSCTLNIQTSHLFLTTTWKVGTMKLFEEKYSFFHLPFHEKVIDNLCRFDKERKRELVVAAELYDHPSFRVLQTIIKTHHFNALQKHIEEIVFSFKQYREFLAEILEWHSELQNVVRYAQSDLKKEQCFSSMGPEKILGFLAEAFCLLQKEGRIVMQIPPDFSFQLADKVRTLSKLKSKAALQ
jgi:hypothetical protein